MGEMTVGRIEQLTQPDKMLLPATDEVERRSYRVSPIDEHRKMLIKIADEVIRVLVEHDLTAGVALEVLDVAQVRALHKCKFHLD